MCLPRLASLFSAAPLAAGLAEVVYGLRFVAVAGSTGEVATGSRRCLTGGGFVLRELRQRVSDELGDLVGEPVVVGVEAAELGGESARVEERVDVGAEASGGALGLALGAECANLFACGSELLGKLGRVSLLAVALVGVEDTAELGGELSARLLGRGLFGFGARGGVLAAEFADHAGEVGGVEAGEVVVALVAGSGVAARAGSLVAGSGVAARAGSGVAGSGVAARAGSGVAGSGVAARAGSAGAGTGRAVATGDESDGAAVGAVADDRAGDGGQGRGVVHHGCPPGAGRRVRRPAGQLHVICRHC